MLHITMIYILRYTCFTVRTAWFLCIVDSSTHSTWYMLTHYSLILQNFKSALIPWWWLYVSLSWTTHVCRTSCNGSVLCDMPYYPAKQSTVAGHKGTSMVSKNTQLHVLIQVMLDMVLTYWMYSKKTFPHKNTSISLNCWIWDRTKWHSRLSARHSNINDQ